MNNETSLFVSHTTKDPRDSNLAHKIAERLRSKGVNVWIAPSSIPPEEKWEGKNRFRNHGKVITFGN